MVLLRTLGLVAALAAPVFSLPSKQDGPVFHKRRGDPLPTIIRATFTLPLQPSQTSSVETSESSPVDVEDPELNLCAITLCAPNTICEVIEGEAQCLPATKCGPNVCGRGLVCCNESCGICTPPNGSCIMLFCGDIEPASETPTA